MYKLYTQPTQLRKHKLLTDPLSCCSHSGQLMVCDDGAWSDGGDGVGRGERKDEQAGSMKKRAWERKVKNTITWNKDTIKH